MLKPPASDTPPPFAGLIYQVALGSHSPYERPDTSLDGAIRVADVAIASADGPTSDIESVSELRQSGQVAKFAILADTLGQRTVLGTSLHFGSHDRPRIAVPDRAWCALREWQP